MAREWYVKINGVDYSIKAPNGRLAIEWCLRRHGEEYGPKERLRISAYSKKDRKIEQVGGTRG